MEYAHSLSGCCDSDGMGNTLVVDTFWGRERDSDERWRHPAVAEHKNLVDVTQDNRMHQFADASQVLATIRAVGWRVDGKIAAPVGVKQLEIRRHVEQ